MPRTDTPVSTRSIPDRIRPAIHAEQEINTSYGLLINLPNTLSLFVTHPPQAKKCVDICVEWKGKRREYTIEDFAQRMGLYED